MKQKLTAGLAILAIGVFLLLFTFAAAFWFLIRNIESMVPQNVVQTLGQTLGPIIVLSATAIYLGIMVWIGSELTIRGIDLLKFEKQKQQEVPQHQ